MREQEQKAEMEIDDIDRAAMNDGTSRAVGSIYLKELDALSLV